MNIPVIYEDEWLVVFDKPSGLLSVPTPRKEARTLTSIANEYYRAKGLACALYPCHRLDRETSGLIIYAKGRAAQEKIADLFRQRKINKRYLAFVRGAPKREKGRISIPIEGQSAVTEYRLAAKNRGFSVAEITPLSGRTNQIRIHFKAIGHPILGETKYAFRRDFELKAKRLCLHAKELAFIHPFTKKDIRLSAPLPLKMREFLDKYARKA